MTIEAHPNGHPVFIEPGTSNPNAPTVRLLRFGPKPTYDLRAGKLMDSPCETYGCKNAQGFAGTAYCRDCAMELWAMIHLATTDGERAAKLNGRHAEHLRFEAETQHRQGQAAAQRATGTQAGHVYYLRVDDLVKIGFTTDLTRRLAEYPPNVKVLAAHPGTPQTERAMHRKFAAHLRRGREWFTPCDEIDAHIERVRTDFPEIRCLYTGEPVTLSS